MSARKAGLVGCCVIAYGFGVATCAAFSDWPWIAAAFNAPLWATTGAAYVTGTRSPGGQGRE